MIIPLRRYGPSSARTIALLTLLLAVVSAVWAANAHAAPVVGVALQSTTDGTAPFDAAAGPGKDTGASNDEVRSYDSVTYSWAINVNSDTGGSETFDKVTFEQTLPAGLSWRAADIPAYCKGAGWGISGQTLTCVYVPPGGTGTTGTTLNFSLPALADGRPDGTVLTPAEGSTSVTVQSGTTTSDPATATAPEVTVRSAPWLDMVKRSPSARIAPGGYYIDYTIALQVPPDRQSTYGRRGILMPSAPVNLIDDLSSISPGAQFVSCSSSLQCTPGSGQQVDISFQTLPDDPATNGSIASGTIRVFVPEADVEASPTGNLNTVNTLTDLDAEGPSADGGTVPSQGDQVPNNSVSYNLITQGGSGNTGFNKRFLAADGSLLPTQSAANDGNGQVLDGQVVLSELRISNNSSTAPAPTPAVCDVWDNERIHLSTDGPGPAAHGGAPVWAQSVPAGWQAGVDYVIEYGTQSTATGADADRWSELKSRTACTDASDTWSQTPPADLSEVTKVRVRLLRDLPPGAGTVTFRMNMEVDDHQEGDNVANFLGTKAGATWSASNYDPNTNANQGRGDRLRVNGITVAVRKRALDPNTSYGSPATIVSGNPVQFELAPAVTALPIAGETPTATDVVVRDRLPLGLTYDASRPTTPAEITPVVTSDAEGRQILTWTIPSMDKGSEPKLTYWAKSSSTTVGSLINEVIVDGDGDVGGRDTFPTANTSDQHYSRQTVTLQSPGGVQISKAALQSVVEPADPLAFKIEYANLTAKTAANVDIIDVLPFTGDGTAAGAVPGRNPASDRSGMASITAVEVANGETVRYTDADPAAVYAATNAATTVDADYGRLPDGKRWCLPAEFGTVGCPADVGAATALRITRDSMPSGASAQITLRLAPTGNRSGNVYSNTAAIRYGSGNLGAVSNVASTRVVASRIGDYVWADTDRDGVQDAEEKPLKGVRVTLTGTDKHGRTVSVTTTTDANGRYLFAGSTQAAQDAGVVDLVSGSYTVTFSTDGLPAGSKFTTPQAPGSTSSTDSDADPATGRASVTLPDPAPTGVDGENLDIDAGVVLGEPVVPKPPTPKPPTPEPPTSEPPVTPPGGGVSPETDERKPVLAITKRAGRRKVRAGKSVGYTIVVRNTGDASARNVVVCDTPGHGLSVRRTPNGATFRSGKMCWKLGTLAAGAKRTVRVTMQTARTLSRKHVTNVAQVTATNTRSRRANAKVRVIRHRQPDTRKPGVTG